MWLKIDEELSRIFCLGISFFFIVASVCTLFNMQVTLVSSIVDEREDFNVNGYTLIAIIFSVNSVSLWFGPYMNYALGAKTTMIISAIGLMVYTGLFILEKPWALYCGTVITGIVLGSLWPAQGHYMIQNSTTQTTPRNVYIFFTLLKTSGIFANTVMFFTLHGKQYIDKPTRMAAVYFIFALSVVGVVALAMLPKSIDNHVLKEYNPSKTLKRSLALLKSRRMLWLTVFFAFTGINQTFWTGVYSSSLGFTLAFGDSAKELVALSGFFMGIGSILGALWPLLLPAKIMSHDLAPNMAVLFAGTAVMMTYLITFIMIPDDAVFGNTESLSFIRPRASLAMLGSFLLSFCETCLSTQTYCVIGRYYRSSTAEATALFRFTKAVSISVAFFYGGHLGLHDQVAILAVMDVVGVAAFLIANHGIRSEDTVKLIPT